MTLSTEAKGVIVVLVVVALVVTGVLVYVFLYPHPGLKQSSSNWAGYVDREKVTNVTGTFTVPPASQFNGSGTASFWVGMGGDSGLLQNTWPFWQAGLVLTTTVYGSIAELFTEGGNGKACGGQTCPDAWSHYINGKYGETITVTLRGDSAGANATITLTVNGTTSVLYPPEWSVLAGVYTFPSAEWIYEAPTGFASIIESMPTIGPPGVLFSHCNDSAGLTDLGSVVMEQNPNSQNVSFTQFVNDSFSAYSYDTQKV